MTYYTVSEARQIGAAQSARQYRSSREILRQAAGERGRFDIFLSHSFSDADLVLGVRDLLQRSGKSVYVDWIDDPMLNRSLVTEATARVLRERMTQCASLVYAATKAATNSKWMPWELGYFDGRKGPEAIAIMPLVEYNGQPLGQEYLELYPSLEKPTLTNAAPIVTKRSGGVTREKFLSDLVSGQGGTAWRLK